MNIFEDSRSKLVANSKIAEKEKDGKTRYQKRLKSHISKNTREFNKIDMNNLFKNGIITISILVHGETDDYLVKLSWGNILDSLYRELKRTKNERLDLRNIIKALIISFNKEDVYIDCNCADFRYRFGYWATKTNISSGEPELRPSDETNPNNELGPGCKHVMLVLANTSWIIKVASVINNYMNYMEKHYENMFADIIYPAVYRKDYVKPTQTTLFDDDTLNTDEETIDISNDEARKKNRFKQGNKYRFNKNIEPNESQEKIPEDEIETEISEEED